MSDGTVDLARADRRQAATTLDAASVELARLAGVYSSKIPAPTREAPFPPAESLRVVQGLQSLSGRAGALAATIRGLPGAEADRTTLRGGRRGGALPATPAQDAELAMAADAFAATVRALAIETLTPTALAPLDAALLAAERLLATRGQPPPPHWG